MAESPWHYADPDDPSLLALHRQMDTAIKQLTARNQAIRELRAMADGIEDGRIRLLGWDFHPVICGGQPVSRVSITYEIKK